MKFICCVLLALLLPHVAHGAEIHKWRDRDGKIHFGDKPPAAAATEQITVKPNVYASPSIEALSEIFSQNEKVVMYGTTWCGYCKKARKYFSANGIRYKEYDIEHSEKGKRDYKKLGAKGIPVILVGKKRLNGFSERSFKRIYAPK
jgi:glutaredoxin